MGKRAASGFVSCISSDLYSLPSEAILSGRGRDGALFGISFLTRQVILPLFIARKQLTSNNI